MTLHRFNGWSDQCLASLRQGLEDFYFSLSGRALGGKWLVVCYDFSSEVSLGDECDLGDEINLVYSRLLGDVFSAGVKFAGDSAADSAFNRVDTQKSWIWGGL